MKKVGEDCLELICDYLKCVEEAMRLLRVYYGDVDFLKKVVKNKIPREFDLEEREFFFHGKGCRVTTQFYEVDFDFLGKGAYGVFDSWRLRKFSNFFNNKYSRLGNLEEQLSQLQECGLVEKVVGSEDTFFLKKPEAHGVEFFKDMGFK